MLDVVVIGALCGGISLVVSVCFWNIRRSRCVHIKSPCLECQREVMTADELSADAMKDINGIAALNAL